MQELLFTIDVTKTVTTNFEFKSKYICILATVTIGSKIMLGS